MRLRETLETISTTLQTLAMPDRLWSIEDIQTYFRVGKTVAYRLKDQPGFPAPIKMYDTAQPRWLPEEIKKWTESRKESA